MSIDSAILGSLPAADKHWYMWQCNKTRNSCLNVAADDKAGVFMIWPVAYMFSAMRSPNYDEIGVASYRHPIDLLNNIYFAVRELTYG